VAFGHSFLLFGWELETVIGIGVLGIFVFIYTRHTPKVAAAGGDFGCQSPPRRNGVSRQAGVGDLGDLSGSGEFRDMLSLPFVCLSFVILSFCPLCFTFLLCCIISQNQHRDTTYTVTYALAITIMNTVFP
jgi:hypothetical protein